MTTLINANHDSALLLNSFIIKGKELLQKGKDVNNKNSVEDSFSQFFLEIDSKITEFYQTLQSKKIKILDSKKLDECQTIITALQTYQSQKISKIFIDAVLAKIQDLQCVQQLVDKTDAEKAQTYLKMGIAYFNQKKYDKAAYSCSQAIALKDDLEKAYLYRKVSLDMLSSIERKKALCDIAKNTCNFQLCGLTDSDIDDILDTLKAKKGEAIALNLRYNLFTDKVVDKLIDLAKNNPCVTQIEYENDKAFSSIIQENRNRCSTGTTNSDFLVAYQKGKDLFEKGEIHEAVHQFLKALNRELHHPIGIESLLSAMYRQQYTFLCHQKAIVGIFPVKSGLITACLDGTLQKWGVDGSLDVFNWGKTDPQEITTVSYLSEKLLIAGHTKGEIILWDLSNLSILQLNDKAHTKPIVNLLRLSDTQFVSYDTQTLKYWDENKCLKTIDEKRATAFEVQSDGTLVFGDAKGILRFLDNRKSDKVHKEMDTKYANLITKIQELKGGKFAIGYGDGYLQVFDSKKFIPIKVVSDLQRAITVLAVLDDKYWVSGSRDGEVLVWDDSHTCVSRFEANASVTSLCIGAAGEVYIGCEDGTLHLWQPSLKVSVPIDDDTLLKPFKINGNLVIITKDSKGRDDMIARGGYGRVYRGQYKDKPVAIKETMEGEEKNLIDEMKVMAQMHNYPTVLSLEGFVQEPKQFQLVMELMTQGSLSSYLKKATSIPWETRWVLMMDIVYGLLCLHANNIVHRDIKADNVLINNNRARISDFGTSRKNIKTKTNQIIGTLGYLDPWLDENNKDRYTEKSDIYSLGNLLWVLLNEKYQEPWSTIMGPLDYMKRLVTNNEKLKIPDNTPPILKDLLEKMWEKQRNKRPHITTVFEKVSKSREVLLKNEPLSNTFTKKEALKPSQAITSDKTNAQKTKISPSKEEQSLYDTFKTMDKKFLECYLLATDQNLASAQYELALCYELGKEVEKDLTKAIYWYQMAANQNHMIAQRRLGECYASGTGVLKDEQEAVKWYRKAAEQGDVTAQARLGTCYLEGIGVQKDEKEAARWFRKAVDQIDGNKQVILDPSNKPLIKEIEMKIEKKPELKVTNVKVSDIPIAFGKEMWATYIGDIGDEPPLPPDIKAILSAQCPFFPGKKVEETHLLVLIPKTVNGKPLTLQTLGELVKKPLKGTPTKYEYCNIGEYKDLPTESSHWVLMTRDIIPGSRSKSYVEQQKLLKGYIEKTQLLYEVPPILEATTCIFMEFLRSGKYLYGQDPWTYTRCQEKYNKDWQLCAGGLASAGLFVDNCIFDLGGVGLGPCRKFF